MKKTITVAIPSYNKEKYIKGCIESVLKNKEHLESIILVDNCSTDKTYEIAKKYEQYIKCYRNETNLGMSGNWNRCIDLCTTEWLMILHADDELVEGAITHYKKLIDTHGSIALIHGESYSKVNGVLSAYTAPPAKNEFWKAGKDALSCAYGVCSAVMVKMEAYRKLGYFISSSLSSDVEMWARVAGKYDIGFVNHPTVIYHVNPSSTGHDSLTKRSLKEIKEDWDNLNKTIAKSYPSEKEKQAFLAHVFKGAPYSYWAVAKANVRVGNYTQALQTIHLIIFEYEGLLPLFSIVGETIKRHLKKRFFS